RLEILLAADEAQLLAMPVIGEGLDDVGAGMHELAVELLDELRVLQYHLRHEGTGLEIAAPLELEEIALGADHRTGGKPLQQALLLRLRLGTVRSFGHHRSSPGMAVLLADQPGSTTMRSASPRRSRSKPSL